jgi:DNA adenine methylase
MMKKVKRPPLNYFGGKFRLAPWILGYFPDHKIYVEPFGGGGSVLLRKQPSYHEIYNDLDGEVVNFFKVLRERPNELLRSIRLTPYSREEQRMSFIPANDELERARRMYVRAWQTHGGGRTQWSSGWRYEIGLARGTRQIENWNDIAGLQGVIDRLKTIQIENDDAFHVITRFDTSETLFYCDPPYLPITRSERWKEKTYFFEMTVDDHVRLAELLNNVKGMVVLSGYDSELYRDLYAGWEMHAKTARTNYQNTKVECVWINRNAIERSYQKSFDLR